MDKIDLQIIKELSEDARKPFRKIAKKIGISTQTVIKRYNEMKERGTIQLCAISINLKKLGYKGIAHLLITHSPRNSLSETMDQLEKIQNIIVNSKAIGDFEGYAILVFKNIEELYEKVLQIKRLPSISNVEVSFTVPSINYFPPKENTFKLVNKDS
jgi:Lrp/AsnC family transcriptional regulator for asnA, asnC and gidA